jgi:hypothetical protein
MRGRYAPICSETLPWRHRRWPDHDELELIGDRMVLESNVWPGHFCGNDPVV